MHKIKGYQYLKKIYESNRSLVYRAIRENNKEQVILKILNNEYATPDGISKFNQEFSFLSQFDNEGVIQAF